MPFQYLFEYIGSECTRMSLMKNYIFAGITDFSFSSYLIIYLSNLKIISFVHTFIYALKIFFMENLNCEYV